MASVDLFETPCLAIMLKSTLDTHLDFLQFSGQVEGEGWFHHISPYQFQITTSLLISSCIYASSCPFGGLSRPLLIVILLTGSDLIDF